jgi:hypothetical protein
VPNVDVGEVGFELPACRRARPPHLRRRRLPRPGAPPARRPPGPASRKRADGPRARPRRAGLQRAFQPAGRVVRRDRLGGSIHEHAQVAWGDRMTGTDVE